MRRILGISLILLPLTFLAPVIGYADDSTETDLDPGLDFETYAASDFASAAPEVEIGVTDPAAVTTLKCLVKINNPHYSSGAPGVIAKMTYNCWGNTSGVLYLSGWLTRYSPGQTGPFTPQASNTGITRNVGPGATGTAYIPASTQPGLNCNVNHWYYGSGESVLVVGPLFKQGFVQSNTVHPQSCS